MKGIRFVAGAACVVFLLSGMGCKGSQPTAPSRHKHLIIMVDDSESAVTEMKSTYEEILSKLAFKASGRGITFTWKWFVNNPRLEIDNVDFKDTDEFNDIVDKKVKTGLFSKERGTNYGTMLEDSADQCTDHGNDDVYELVLSDGAPDDSAADVIKGAEKLSQASNLKRLLILPVKAQFRDKLIKLLKSLKPTLLTGGEEIDGQDQLDKFIKELL